MKHITTGIQYLARTIVEKCSLGAYLTLLFFFCKVAALNGQANLPPTIISGNAVGFNENSTDIVVNVQTTDDTDSETSNSIYYGFSGSPIFSPDESI